MGSESLLGKATRALAQSFSTWIQLTFGATSFFVVGEGGCPVYCRIVSSIPGLPSLYASSIPLQLCQPQMSPDITQSVLGGKIVPHAKSTFIPGGDALICSA